jgi:hypothetical protein
VSAGSVHLQTYASLKVGRIARSCGSRNFGTDFPYRVG